MKICTKCNQNKPVEEFSWRNKAAGKRSGLCKACHTVARRAHYDTNREKLVTQMKMRHQELRDKIWEYKNSHPCVDCGFSNPRALQFDHLPGSDKQFDIASAPKRGFSWDKILEEIAKCEVVCANCHSIRTHDRGGWVRNLVVEV